MKILFLADANSPHVQKWSFYLSANGLEIAIFSFRECIIKEYKKNKIKVYSLSYNTTYNKSDIVKLSYFKSLLKLKKIIKDFKPDILHSHYATSYGLIGVLSNFHPHILSVWGSDIFEFPNKSFFHKNILKYILKKSDKILSTSYIMGKETKKYTTKDIIITPFGIDLDIFKPLKSHSLFERNDIIIGTIKGLEKHYGIEYLIKAFKILVDKYPQKKLKLLIVGGGTYALYLKNLTKKLKIDNKTIFTGRVEYSKMPQYHNMLSVFVAVSDSESFGVSVIESSACEKPVVVSDVGGLPEVVEKGVTGFVVPKQNPKATAKAIEDLIINKDLRKKMGMAGRERVNKLYKLEESIYKVIDIYKSIEANI